MSIEIEQVCAGYTPDALVIDGVSLSVPDHSIVTILGPNGSGKSTLLKSAMGMVKCRAGRVLVDGKDVTGVPVHERAVRHGVAYVPQLHNVFGPLSIRENLELGGTRMPRRERRARIEQLLGHYPSLGSRPHAKADALSGGERQMLALARALMTRPRYLLLDEPSAGLSPLMLTTLFEDLVKVREREQATILIVEQNAAQSLAISDRGLVLAMGRVAIEAVAQQLLDDPQVSELYLGGSRTNVPSGDQEGSHV